MKELELLLARVEAMRKANKEVSEFVAEPLTAVWHDGVDVTYAMVIDLIKIMMKEASNDKSDL